MRSIPDFLPAFVRQAEGLWLTSRQDMVGRWTVGYGHTGADCTGPMTISPAQADSLLFADLVKAATALALKVRGDVLAGLTDHQYAALVSFVFNLGIGDPKKPDWVIWKLLNAGQTAAVPVQMLRFDHGEVNGKLVEVPGLFNRRAAEVTLWKTGDVGAAIAVVQAAPVQAPSSGVTTAIPTPPTPMSAKPTLGSKSVVSGLATGALAAAAPFVSDIKQWGDQVNAAITPYVGSSAILQHIQGGLMVALAACAAATAIFAILKNREAS